MIGCKIEKFFFKRNDIVLEVILITSCGTYKLQDVGFKRVEIDGGFNAHEYLNDKNIIGAEVSEVRSDCDTLSVRLSNGYFIHLGWSIDTIDGSTYQHLRIFHEAELGKEDKEYIKNEMQVLSEENSFFKL
ncbi:hypothetical protein JMG10_02625 [Nostoc ellipsosporum NOK]|nr:hypothetical protein [Nostoc ellipsosporum NOK]